MRCDRNLPCLTCVKHKCSTSCSYPPDSISALDLGMAGNVSIFRTFRANNHSTAPSSSRSDTGSQNGPSKGPMPPQLTAMSQLNSTDLTTTPKSEVYSEISALKMKLHQLESSIGAPTPPLPMGDIPRVLPADGQMLPPQQQVFYQPFPNPEQLGFVYQQYQPLLQPQLLFNQPQQQHQHHQQQQQHQHQQQHLIQLAQQSQRLGQPGPLQVQPVQFQPHPIDVKSLSAPRLDLLHHHLPTPISEKNSAQANSSPNNSTITSSAEALASSQPFSRNANLLPPPQAISLHSNSQSTSRPIDAPPDIHSSTPQRSVSMGLGSTNPTYLGVNLYDTSNLDEEMDIYGGYNSIFEGFQDHEMNYGPFAWLTFIRKDRFCNMLWNFIKTNGKKTGEPQLVPDDNQEERTAPHEKEFQHISIKREEITPFNLNEIKVQVNKEAISLGLTVYEGELDPKLNLLERIRISLPTKRSIWILINRFFRRVYPYLPLLDETHFRSQISRILGPEVYTDEKYEQIIIDSKNDFATLGTLLIVLRIAYLSSFSNKNTLNEKILASAPGSDLAEMKYILLNPVNIDVIGVARLCLGEFDLYKKNALGVLQCVLFLRLYGSLSPEDGDGTDGNDGHVLNSVCIQMSYCMGLNREPTNFRNNPEKEKDNNLKRKIWLFLKLIDMHLAYEFGFPLAMHDGFSDIQRPYFGSRNSNTFDINMERTLCDFLVTVDDTIDQFRSVLSRCLSLKNKLKMHEVTELISQLEIKMKFGFGTLSDYTKIMDIVEYPFIRVMKCKFYLSVRIFTLTLYYHFYLNYEQKGMSDLCYFYIRKMFSMHIGEVLPEILPLILHNDKNFENVSSVPDLILNPVIEFALHKGNQFKISLYLRLVDTILMMKNESDLHKENMAHNPIYNLKFTRLCTLAKLVEKILKFSTKCLARLSLRYYYAWRVSKAHFYLCNIIQSETYQKYAREYNHRCIDFTSEQLGELIEMAEAAFAKLKLAVQRDHKYAQAEANEEPEEPIAVTVLEGPIGATMNTGDVGPFPSSSHVSASEEYARVWDSGTTGGTSLSLDLEDFGFVGSGAIDDLWKHISNFTGVVDQQIEVGQSEYF